jgi:hypothetical protein
MMPIAFARSLVLAAASVAGAAFIAGCAAPPPQAAAISDELPFDQAVVQATDALIAQTQTMPAFLQKVEAKLAKKSVVIDAMIDSGTGQQTMATKQLEKYVTDRLAANEQFEVLPFQLASLPKTQYLLTGTMTRVQKTGGKGSFKINLALTELKSGNTVAQASAVAREQGVDTAPTPYYRDSPVLVKDKVIEGYIRTAQTPPGQRADSIYFERIATATLIDNATNLYNNERYQDALGQFKNALSTPAGEQLRVLNGLYLSNFKLGRMADAEQAFGRVVALGIAYNELGVKFLFNPGGTEFWSDQKISGPYQMWLRQIAREGNAAKVCMNVVGHTSRTGSEQVNDTLSQQRATFIRQRLAAESADLANRTKAVGMGFRQNIVGSGTDDVVDALDRRGVFKIVPCG